MRKKMIALPFTENSLEALVMVHTKELDEINKTLADGLGISKAQLKTVGKVVNVKTEPKIGRNDVCPCGSGLKYKKCCIGK